MSIFTCCMKKPKKNFKIALKKAIRHKLDIKMPQSELMIEEDPFLRLGKFVVLNSIIFSMFYLLNENSLLLDWQFNNNFLNIIIGFGFNAYFDVIRQLLFMMIFISIVTIPVMMTYASYSGLSTTAMAMFNQYSLGNMGKFSFLTSR